MRNVLERIVALTPAERYRLAAILFGRGERASAELAHAIVASGVTIDEEVIGATVAAMNATPAQMELVP